MGDFDVPPPDQLTLRAPTIGASLPRRPQPHLLSPEEMDLGGPPTMLPPPGSAPPSVADLMSAVGNYAEVPAPGPRRTPSVVLPPTPPPATRAPVVHLDGEASGRATPVGPTGEGELRASVGTDHARVTAHGGMETRRDDTGRASVEGSAGGSIHRHGHHGSQVELEGGVHGLGTGHPTGSAAARARLGSERGPHFTVGVDGEHLGAAHPEVSGRVGASTGETGVSGTVEVGGEPGHAPSVGGSLTLRPDLATALTLSGSGETGGEHPEGRAGVELRRHLAPHIDLTAGVNANGLGGSAPEVTGTVGFGGRF